jgi:hypothetical protein
MNTIQELKGLVKNNILNSIQRNDETRTSFVKRISRETVESYFNEIVWSIEKDEWLKMSEKTKSQFCFKLLGE